MSISKISDTMSTIIALLYILCFGVERPGEGADKKQEVVDATQELLDKLDFIPAAIKGLLAVDAIIGFFIDIIAGLLEKTTADEKLRPYADVGLKIASLIDGVIKLQEESLGGGTGAEKRAAAIAKLKELLSALTLPAWAKLLVENETIIGKLIDVFVATLNKTGIFAKNSA